LFPRVSAATGALAVGALFGMILSLIGLATGLIKRSYDDEPEVEEGELPTGEPPEEDNYNHRLEALKEIVFLLPMIVCGVVALQVFKNVEAVRFWWVDVSQFPVVAGLSGSLFGYFVGCAVVWATRILGTLGFGKEAMGLGDMHLMGAAGTIIGPLFVVIAFFIAPFFGLTWAAYQAFFKKTKQIPYGPFLSMGIFAVIIFHDWVRSYMQVLLR
jgi:leader peptidase (prepilin peptidase)/N-methyltransferase